MTKITIMVTVTLVLALNGDWRMQHSVTMTLAIIINHSKECGL